MREAGRTSCGTDCGRLTRPCPRPSAPPSASGCSPATPTLAAWARMLLLAGTSPPSQNPPLPRPLRLCVPCKSDVLNLQAVLNCKLACSSCLAYATLNTGAGLAGLSGSACVVSRKLACSGRLDVPCLSSSESASAGACGDSPPGEK